MISLLSLSGIEYGRVGCGNENVFKFDPVMVDIEFINNTPHDLFESNELMFRTVSHNVCAYYNVEMVFTFDVGLSGELENLKLIPIIMAEKIINWLCDIYSLKRKPNKGIKIDSASCPFFAKIK